jgi:hypothetical protein
VHVAANLSEVVVKPADVLIAVHQIPLESWGFPVVAQFEMMPDR